MHAKMAPYQHLCSRPALHWLHMPACLPGERGRVWGSAGGGGGGCGPAVACFHAGRITLASHDGQDQRQGPYVVVAVAGQVCCTCQSVVLQVQGRLSIAMICSLITLDLIGGLRLGLGQAATPPSQKKCPRMDPTSNQRQVGCNRGCLWLTGVVPFIISVKICEVPFFASKEGRKAAKRGSFEDPG